LQDAADIESVHLGQQQVKHNKVGLILAGQLQRFQAIVSDEHPVTLALQIQLDQLYDARIIINYQDVASGHLVYPASTTASIVPEKCGEIMEKAWRVSGGHPP